MTAAGGEVAQLLADTVAGAATRPTFPRLHLIHTTGGRAWLSAHPLATDTDWHGRDVADVIAGITRRYLADPQLPYYWQPTVGGAVLLCCALRVRATGQERRDAVIMADAGNLADHPRAQVVPAAIAATPEGMLTAEAPGGIAVVEDAVAEGPLNTAVAGLWLALKAWQS